MRVLTRFLFPFFSCKVWNLPVLEKKTQLTTVSMETVRMAKFPTQKEKINYFTNSVFQVFRLHAFFFIPTIREVGGTPRKIGLGCARSASQNPCAIYEKICDVRYPIYDLTKNSKDLGPVSRKARKLIGLEKLF